MLLSFGDSIDDTINMICLILTLNIFLRTIQASTDDIFQEKQKLQKKNENLFTDLIRSNSLKQKGILSSEDTKNLETKKANYKKSIEDFDSLEQKVIDEQDKDSPSPPSILARLNGRTPLACPQGRIDEEHERINKSISVFKTPIVNQKDLGVCYAITASNLLAGHTTQPISYLDIALLHAQTKSPDKKIFQDPSGVESGPEAPPPLRLSLLEGGSICNAINAANEVGACPKSKSLFERQDDQDAEELEDVGKNFIKSLSLVFEDLTLSGMKSVWQKRGKSMFENFKKIKSANIRHPLYHQSGTSTDNQLGFISFYRGTYLSTILSLREKDIKEATLKDIQPILNELKMSAELSNLQPDEVLQAVNGDLGKSNQELAEQIPGLNALTEEIKESVGEKSHCIWGALGTIEKSLSEIERVNKAQEEIIEKLIFQESDPWMFLSKGIAPECANNTGRLQKMNLTCLENDYLTGFFAGKEKNKSHPVFQDQKIQLIRDDLMNNLNAGQPLGISYCSSIKKPGNEDKTFRPFSQNCTPHATTVIGARINPVNGKCQYLLQESDGDTCRGLCSDAKAGMKGKLWVNENDLVRNIFDTSSLKKN